jgi:Tol biopolymer transport system component
MMFRLILRLTLIPLLALIVLVGAADVLGGLLRADGDYLAYVVTDTRTYRLDMIDMARRVTITVEPTTPDLIDQPVWERCTAQPCAGRLAYLVRRGGGSEFIVYDPALSTWKRITGASYYARYLDWTPEGRLSFVDGGTLYRLSPDADTTAQAEVIAFPYNVSNPSWSPDGEWLAVEAGGANFLSNLALMHLPTGSVIFVAAHVAFDYTPRLSSQHDLVFLSERAATRTGQDLFLYEWRSDSATRLTSETFQRGQLTWSPDGRYLAFAGQVRVTLVDLQLSLYDRETREITRLAPAASNDQYPAWSPHSDALAFVSNRAGDNDLYVVRLDDGAVEQLTYSAESEQWPAWGG